MHHLSRIQLSISKQHMFDLSWCYHKTYSTIHKFSSPWTGSQESVAVILNLRAHSLSSPHSPGRPCLSKPLFRFSRESNRETRGSMCIHVKNSFTDPVNHPQSHTQTCTHIHTQTHALTHIQASYLWAAVCESADF